MFLKIWELAVRNLLFEAYQRALNLRTLLIGAQFTQKQQQFCKGNSPCQQVRCKTCRHIQPIITFNSSVTGKTYPIKAMANCKMSNVVYVIECTKCNKQYVGETKNTLHIWMNEHQSNIKHRRLEKPVASNFDSEGHSLEDNSMYVIKQIHKEVNFWKRKISHWI